MIALWVASHYFRRPLRYIGFGGQGKQVRDVLHIEDLCDLIADQLERFDLYAGGLFNAGGGAACTVSLQELTAVCEEITGNRIPIAGDPATRPADLRLFVTDHRRLTALGGWRPHRDVRTAAANICDWIRREEMVLRPLLGQ